MQKIFDAIIHVGTSPAKLALILLPVACIIAAAFADPSGAVNTFMIKMIDVMFAFWPSTPNDKNIGHILSTFALEYPQIGWGLIYEVFQGIAGILTLALFIKLVKLLPFF